MIDGGRMIVRPAGGPGEIQSNPQDTAAASVSIRSRLVGREKCGLQIARVPPYLVSIRSRLVGREKSSRHLLPSDEKPLPLF
jgi:hypothetical protein